MRPELPWRSLVWYLLFALLFLYLDIFVLPATPIRFSGDHWTYLQNGARMLRGELIYRDFFQFTPPQGERCQVPLLRLPPSKVRYAPHFA